ncbi:Ig-like domain-containing protein [Myxococcota bacterium]|nr:Ig-like domain-containing protein [Myxococcota bacterium]
MRPIRRLPHAVLVLAAAMGCSEPAEPADPVPARIEITPSGALLTPSTPSQRLTARVLDASGAVVEAPITWESSAPSTIRVEGDGTVTAVEPLGSAVVTAQAGDARVEVLVVAASPVPGAVVVGDDQVVGQPEPRDETAPVEVGYRYDVTLSGVEAPAVGTVLLGNGEKAVGGRVAEVSGSVVTLEMVPLDEVFAAIDIGASLDLSRAPYVTPDAVESAFHIEPQADGSVTMTMGPAAFPTSAPEARAEFEVGPFECETELSAIQIGLAQSSLTFTPALTYDIEWNDATRRIVVGGDPQVTLEVTPTLSAAIDGSLTCKMTFREIHVPVPGVLGLALGAVVPLGAGFEVAGTVPIGGVGATFTSTVGASVRMGFECDPDCAPVQTVTPIVEGSVEPVWPTAFEGIQIEASFYAFLFADLEAGARFTDRLRVEAIESKAGLALAAEIASEQTQADDRDFAGSYGASFEASIGAGADFESFLEFVSVSVAELELRYEAELASSPRGTAKADRDAFAVGDDVRFTVTLEPDTVDFFGVGYNVRAVRIYRRTDESLVLANEVAATAGQSEFEVPWVATVDGTIGDDFIAFVETELRSEPRIEVGDVTSSDLQGGSLTFQELSRTHWEWSEGEARQEYTEERTMSGSLTLRLVAGVAGARGGWKGGGTYKEFEIVGGTFGFEETYDYFEFSPDQGWGTCTYDETIEDHSTTTGSAPASGDAALYLVNDGTYEVDVSEALVSVVTEGVWTARYDFLGEDTSCRTEVTDEYNDTDDAWVDFEGEGTTDSEEQTTFSGSTTETYGDTTVTTTWTLTLN